MPLARAPVSRRRAQRGGRVWAITRPTARGAARRRQRSRRDSQRARRGRLRLGHRQRPHRLGPERRPHAARTCRGAALAKAPATPRSSPPIPRPRAITRCSTGLRRDEGEGAPFRVAVPSRRRRWRDARGRGFRPLVRRRRGPAVPRARASCGCCAAPARRPRREPDMAATLNVAARVQRLGGQALRRAARAGLRAGDDGGRRRQSRRGQCARRLRRRRRTDRRGRAQAGAAACAAATSSCAIAAASSRCWSRSRPTISRRSRRRASPRAPAPTSIRLRRGPCGRGDARRRRDLRRATAAPPICCCNAPTRRSRRPREAGERGRPCTPPTRRRRRRAGARPGSPTRSSPRSTSAASSWPISRSPPTHAGRPSFEEALGAAAAGRRGDLGPDAMIPVAEKLGLIELIDERVLELVDRAAGRRARLPAFDERLDGDAAGARLVRTTARPARRSSRAPPSG